MKRLPIPELPPGPLAELFVALHALHQRAGWPSLRRLASVVGCSHTTVSRTFSEGRLPNWGWLELLVEAMGGDVTTFRTLWIAAGSDRGNTAPTQAEVAVDCGSGRTVIGRGVETAFARQLTLAGRSGMLLVTGEAGIGKSSLLRSCRQSLTPEVVFAVGTCLPRGRELTLLPLTEALRSIYAADEGQWVNEALAQCAPYVRIELARLLPELEAAPVAGRQHADPFAKIRLFSAVCAGLAGLAAVRRTALVLEDLHWADSTTLELLDYLIATSDPPGLAILATFRTDEPTTATTTEDWRIRVSGLPTVTTLPLRFLSISEVALQVANLTGQTPTAAAVAKIHQRTQGHPLFTELVIMDGNRRGLPARLAEMLDGRFLDLTHEAWALCRMLATLQRPVSADNLHDLVAGTDHGVTDALRELDHRGIIITEESSVSLRHPLYAEAARRRMVATETRAEHARAAKILARWPGIPAAEIASHWQSAGQPAEEITWRVRAAGQAHERYAFSHEAQHWVRALELCPDGTWLSPDSCSKLQAFCAAMDALEATADVHGARLLAERALHALETAGPSEDRAEVLWRAGSLIGISDPSRGEALLTTALDVYEQHPGSRGGRLRALSKLAALLRGQGRHEDAGRLIATAIDLSNNFTDPALQRTLLATDAWHRMQHGKAAEARERLNQARQITVSPPDPPGDIWLDVIESDVLLKAGGTRDDIDQVCRRALSVLTEWELTSFSASMLLSNISQLNARSGRVQRARDIATTRPDGPVLLGDWPVHLQRARLDLLSGDTAAAQQRLELISLLPLVTFSTSKCN